MIKRIIILIFFIPIINSCNHSQKKEKEGWCKIFNKTTHKIIGKKYYHKDKLYTSIQLNELLNCSELYCKPLILDDRDTIFANKKDSIQVKFIFPGNAIRVLNMYVYKDRKTYLNQGEPEFLIIYNPREHLHITFDSFEKHTFYYIRVQYVPYENELNPKEYCDVHYYATDKYVYVE